MKPTSPLSNVDIKKLREIAYDLQVCAQKIDLAEQAGLDCTQCRGEHQFCTEAIKKLIEVYGKPQGN